MVVRLMVWYEIRQMARATFATIYTEREGAELAHYPLMTRPGGRVSALRSPNAGS